MSPNLPQDKLAEWLKSLPPEKIQELNKKEINRTEEYWKSFIFHFNNGYCLICGKPLKTFSEKSPCLHWLLRPKGFKKKHFPLLYEKFTYFRIEAYVRWVASVDGSLRNINDIKIEHPGENLIDFTARYKHCTWSFSCNKSDFEGHPTSYGGNFPHYHIRMNLDGKQFIKYSDFHIPFHKEDLYYIELFTKHSDVVISENSRGAGIGSLLGTNKGIEAIIEHSTPTDNYEEATFNIQTLIKAPEGETISGSLIADAMAEAKTKGKTLAAILRDKPLNANIITTVSPGLGVPESNQRIGGRKKQNDTNDTGTDNI